MVFTGLWHLMWMHSVAGYVICGVLIGAGLVSLVFAYLGISKAVMLPLAIVSSVLGLGASLGGVSVLAYAPWHLLLLIELILGASAWALLMYAALVFVPVLLNLFMLIKAFTAEVRDMNEEAMGTPWIGDFLLGFIKAQRYPLIFGLGGLFITTLGALTLSDLYRTLDDTGFMTDQSLSLWSYDPVHHGKAYFVMLLIGVTSFGFCLMGILALVLRLRVTLSVVKMVCIATWVMVCMQIWAAYNLLSYIASIFAAQNSIPQASDTFLQFLSLTWPAMIMGAVALVLYLLVNRRVVLESYSRDSFSDPLPGDHRMEDLRTHGRDPRYRQSSYGSVVLHGTVIFGPILWQMVGCSTGCDVYDLMDGTGQPAVAVVKVQQQEVQDQIIVNPNSPFTFDIPDRPDEMMEKVLEQTEQTHSAENGVTAAMMGTGDGTEGGFEGLGGPLRFIRLKYDGDNWDDGMGKPKGNMDNNFLVAFKRLSRLRNLKIQLKAEKAITATQIFSRFNKAGRRPPFLYMTGSGRIRMSQREMDALRKYTLEEGGLLFADAGGRRFNGEFYNLMRRVYPDKQFVDIPTDDLIFQIRYHFPDGAPPMWAHGSRKAKGIKHDGRWVVFYHPGDMGDAWENGRSGATEELTEKAYEMGVNVVYYAIQNYVKLNKKHIDAQRR